MTNYPTCSTCKFREVHKQDSFCTHNKIGEDGYVLIDSKDDSLVYSYQEDGSFSVGMNFGCIHHEGTE
jgi:hypothetical protein